MHTYLFIYGTLHPDRAPREIAAATRRLVSIGPATIHARLYISSATTPAPSSTRPPHPSLASYSPYPTPPLSPRSTPTRTSAPRILPTASISVSKPPPLFLTVRPTPVRSTSTTAKCLTKSLCDALFSAAALPKRKRGGGIIPRLCPAPPASNLQSCAQLLPRPHCQHSQIPLRRCHYDAELLMQQLE